MSVSVVMPNFNSGQFIRDTLASVVDDPAVQEVVIYDNGSTDDSIEIAESFGPKVRIIRGSSNLGATMGRHQAILNATSDFICYLDGDDTLSSGAVGIAVRKAVDERLDIALFDLINVDADGRNPAPFILPPRTVFDGRTACELTLGAWEMHIWGLIRKSVYLEAWSGFRQHGYSDDELLTRSILLKARRISGCDAKIFYRVIPKPPQAHRIIGVNRTSVRTLALGIDGGLAPAALKRQHNLAVQFLAGLVRRGLGGAIDRREVADIVDEYLALRLPFRPSLRSATIDRLIRVTRPFFPTRTADPCP